MASTFTKTRNSIIEKALKRLGVIGEGDTITSEMYNSAADDLDLINIGLDKYKRKLWALEECSQVLPLPSTVTNNGATYYCIVPHTSAATDEPGVGVNWALYWYASETSNDSPAAWALATGYSDGATITLPDDTRSIETAYIRDTDDDYHLDLINRFEEDKQYTKWETGTPYQARFDRYASPPTLKVYFKPNRNDFTIFYRRIRLLGLMTTGSSTPDVPAGWIDYLIYALAYKQGEEYGVKQEKLIRLGREAAKELILNLRDQHEDTDSVLVDPAY